MAAPCLKWLLNIVKAAKPVIRSQNRIAHKIVNRAFCAGGADSSEAGKKLDAEVLFLNSEVQRLLYRVTHLDLNRIFKVHKQRLSTPDVKLLTEADLQQHQDDVERKAKEKIKFPPVMNARKPIEHVLAYDPELAMFDQTKIVFTDITYDIKHRDRFIVVRDLDGSLRKATWAERDRMLQMYFPVDGRKMVLPRMFQPDLLEDVLNNQNYEFILERACLQFEPDDPEYHRVTQRTYVHIDQTRSFQDLRSTRHFGVLVFYLLQHRKVDNLLIDMIQRNLLSDAMDVLKLYHMFHPDCSSKVQIEELGPDADPLEVLRIFAETDAQKGSEIELAVQSYEEMHPHRKEAPS